jgi:Icc-related predicted phosphoesterase
LIRALKESKNERELVDVAVQTLQEHGCSVKRVSPIVPALRKESSTSINFTFEIEAEGFKTWVSLSKEPNEEPDCFVRSDWPDFVPEKLSSSNPIDEAGIREFLATRCAMLFETNSQSGTVNGAIHVVHQPRNLFEELASLSKYGLCAVIGNDDHPAVRSIIHGKGVYNVHERPVILGEYAIIGMEGACIKPGELNPGVVLYNEDEVSAHLNSFWEHVSDKRLIIISHNPPFETLDHALRFGERDIGSETLRGFIQENKEISLVISGHVHYCGGKSANLGNAVVVNAASHDHQGDPGRVAIVDLSTDGLPTVQWHILHELSGIFGVGERTAYKFQNAGIRKPEDLVAANLESVSTKTGLSVRTLRGLALRARAIVEDRVYRLGSFTPPPRPRIYLDIETDLTQTLVWLVGVHSDARNASACFFANSPDEEKEILLSLLGFVGKEPDATICSFSGSNFERRVLQKRLQAYQLPTDLGDRIVDLCPLVRRSVALPLKSYKLKNLASHFGYQYKHRKIDGWDVAMMYIDYLRTKDASLRQTFEEYNHDDVMSLPHLIENISAHARGVIKR